MDPRDRAFDCKVFLYIYMCVFFMYIWTVLPLFMYINIVIYIYIYMWIIVQKIHTEKRKDFLFSSQLT